MQPPNPQPSIVLSELAHELRTPLTFLCGAIDLLEMEDGASSPLLAQMRQSVWGIVRLLDNAVLYEEFAQGDPGANVALHTQPIDLKKFCQKLLAEIVPPEQLPLVETRWPEAEILLQIDRELLRTLLGNLIANAVRFSRPEQPIHLSIHQDRSGIALTLRDWGVGIPLEEQRQVGEPFFRASNVTHRPGLGLGLSLAKRCAKILQSQITLVSQDGKGCAVTWSLPTDVFSRTL
ncbi:MAG: HAMP domain-containing histidine kinase [Alkalinema sp. RU_4_3]|nr:HAMP domain-containing histidine kinase [Alkalinema sp. RU_4_3]